MITVRLGDALSSASINSDSVAVSSAEVPSSTGSTLTEEGRERVLDAFRPLFAGCV